LGIYHIWFCSSSSLFQRSGWRWCISHPTIIRSLELCTPQVHKQVYLNSFTNSSQTPQTLSPVPLSFSRFKSDQYTLSGSGTARCLEEEAISGGFYVRKVGEIHHDVEDGSSTFGGRGRNREGSGRVRVGFLDGGDGRFGGRGGLRGCVG
jgi:hypothetical protein